MHDPIGPVNPPVISNDFESPTRLFRAFADVCRRDDVSRICADRLQPTNQMVAYSETVNSRRA